MLIYRRNAMMAGGGKLSAKSYVQDGLVAMWDGIENAGWGIHDPNATVWKDLSGNEYNMSLVAGKYKFEENCLNKTGYYYAGRVAIPVGAWETVESCMIGGSGHMIDLGYPSTDREILRAYSRTFVNGNSKWVSTSSFNTVTIHYDSDSKVASSLFLDGQSKTMSSGGTSYSRLAGSSDGVIRLGHSNSSWEFYGRYFNIRLYSRALTAAEIAANYAVDKARFNLPDVT